MGGFPTVTSTPKQAARTPWTRQAVSILKQVNRSLSEKRSLKQDEENASNS